MAIRRETVTTRLSASDLCLIRQAAALLDQSVNAFCASALIQAARQAAEPSAALRLSNRDRDAFLGAIDNPPPPNAKLRKAVRAYDRNVSSVQSKPAKARGRCRP